MKNQNNRLFNETTFYPAFINDMLHAEKEVIIYCPFISKFRADFFRKTLIRLKLKNINVFIFTRPISEHKGFARREAELAIEVYEKIGVNVICLNGSIHEKVAVIDRKITWQGSLNILSQKSSKELMMRIADEDFARQIMSKLEISKKLIIKNQIKVSASCLKFGFVTWFLGPIINLLKWSLFFVYQIIVVLLKSILLK